MITANSPQIQNHYFDDIYEKLYQEILFGKYSTDRKYFELMDIFGNLCKFPFIHGYSIGEVNFKDGFIEILNPQYDFKIHVNTINNSFLNHIQ